MSALRICQAPSTEVGLQPCLQENDMLFRDALTVCVNPSFFGGPHDLVLRLS